MIIPILEMKKLRQRMFNYLAKVMELRSVIFRNRIWQWDPYSKALPPPSFLAKLVISSLPPVLSLLSLGIYV